MFRDERGLEMTAASQEAVDAFDATIEAYLAQSRDTGQLLKQLGDADGDMVMGHVLRGYLFRLPAQAHLLQRAEQSLAAARAQAGTATAREQAHVRALAAWSQGHLRRANAIWEEILIDHPHDILAFRLVHFLHFYVGDLARMRDSASRIMPRWSADVPGFGYVLGCHAFALEENGRYGEAEPAGRRAVAINEDDIWAGHAVVHALEMTGRREDGIRWVDEHEAAWRARGIFAHHIWWHRALHYLETERYGDVLAAFDRQFWTEPSEDNTDIGNASSMLMRLAMLGLDVGKRWDGVAEVCAGRLDDRLRAFNDVHFMMALAMGGRTVEAEALLQSMRDFAQAHGGDGDNTVAAVYREAGVPVAEAILAYAEGNHGRVVELMRETRYHMWFLGGSWVQRDCWVRMLIDSAIRDGQDRFARALLAERVAAQPTSGPSWRTYGDVLGRLGAEAEAATAQATARNLLAA